MHEKVFAFLNNFDAGDYLLLLSGGESPRELYKEFTLNTDYPLPGAVAMVDDRWGEDPFHENSNYKMIDDIGLLDFYLDQGVPFFPILTGLKIPEEEASRYSGVLERLFDDFGKNVVAVMGMGVDGHTAGVLPGTAGVESPKNVIYYQSQDKYKSRITITLDCIEKNVKNVILLLNTEEKCARFHEYINSEFENESTRPVRVLKGLGEDRLEVLCTSQ